jgi:predicted nucleic acid-binding protein
MTLQAVFDTVTLLQAAANPTGPAGGCLRLVTDGKVVLHMSEDGFTELADVLGRAKVRNQRLPEARARRPLAGSHSSPTAHSNRSASIGSSLLARRAG